MEVGPTTPSNGPSGDSDPEDDESYAQYLLKSVGAARV